MWQPCGAGGVLACAGCRSNALGTRHARAICPACLARPTRRPARPHAQVMYDASGVRLHAGKQASVLNMIITELPPDHPVSNSAGTLKDTLGHTPLQVGVGGGWGVGGGVGVCVWGGGGPGAWWAHVDACTCLRVRMCARLCVCACVAAPWAPARVQLYSPPPPRPLMTGGSGRGGGRAHRVPGGAAVPLTTTRAQVAGRWRCCPFGRRAASAACTHVARTELPGTLAAACCGQARGHVVLLSPPGVCVVTVLLVLLPCIPAQPLFASSHCHPLLALRAFPAPACLLIDAILSRGGFRGGIDSKLS